MTMTTDQQIQALQQQRDKLAAQFTAAQSANEELRRDAADVHRLRGEVTMLRQQVSENEKGRMRAATAISQPTVNLPLRSVPQSEMSQLSKNTANNMKQLMLGMKIYAMRHNDQFATNLNQIKEYVGSLTGGGSWETFEFVPNSDRVNETMPNALVFRERVARQAADGKWLRVYGFASGLAFEQISEDGNFAAWEKQHGPKLK